MATSEWYRGKAKSFSEAWYELYGVVPKDTCIALAMAPPCLETRCGDAWPGERNWGATNLRKLNADERAVIAAAGRELLAEVGITRELDVEAGERLEFTDVPQRWKWMLLPEVEGTHPQARTLRQVSLTAAEATAIAPLTPTVAKGHEVRAKRVQQLLRERLPLSPAGTPEDGRTGAIHCDSHPGYGPFFVWFATFETDVAGAKYYLRILCGKDGTRPAKRVCETGGTPYQLAAAMYSAGYYGGFHEKTKDYPDPLHAGSTVKGSELNIRAYAGLIAKHQPAILAALRAKP